MKGKLFQNDCLELDHVALPTEIFILPRHQDLAHRNLLVFKEDFFLVLFFLCFAGNKPRHQDLCIYF